MLARFAALPQIVAVIERGDRRAVGVTVEGVPVELVAAEPEPLRHRAGPRHGLAGVRRGARAAARRARRGGGRTGRWTCPGVRPSCARSRFAASRRDLSSWRRFAATCTATRPGPTAGRASRRWARGARERGYDYLAICDHTPAVGAVRGLTPDDVRRQGEEIAAANETAGAVSRAPRDRMRHPARRSARSSRRHPRRARLGPGERPRWPAHAASAR